MKIMGFTARHMLLASVALSVGLTMGPVGSAFASSALIAPKRLEMPGPLQVRQTKRRGFWIFQSKRRKALRRKARRKKTRRTARAKRKAAKPVAPPKWQVDGPASGPIHIVISLPEQKATVFRDGKHVVTSRVSTGKPGYSTPSGVFSILEKRRRHFSNLYANAPMPYMQRLTWGGIALHAGVVPDYPASHGCIRLPKKFASELFAYTKRGAHVIVANSETVPVRIDHPLLFHPLSAAPIKFEAAGHGAVERSVRVKSAMLQARLETEAKKTRAQREIATYPVRILITRRTALQIRKDMQRTFNELGYQAGDPDGILGRRTYKAVRNFQKDMGLKPTGIISEALIDKLYEMAGIPRAANGQLYVRQKFRDVFQAPITIRDADKPLGTHFLTATELETDTGRAQWMAMTLKPRVQISSIDAAVIPKESLDPLWSVRRTLDRIVIAPELRQRINRMLTSGSSISITDNGLGRMTGRGTDFIVLNKSRFKSKPK